MDELKNPFSPRQTPAPGEVFFDHVAWLVDDVDAASAVLARLGFTLTPYSVHANRDPESGVRVAQGTANRLAMLETGYIEILCEAGDVTTPVVEDLRARVARYEGVHLLAFSTADAKAEYERIRATGIALQPMVQLRRDVEAADGTDTEVRFSVIRAAFDAIPEGRIQMLSHETPEHMWQDRYIARKNAITSVIDAVVCVDDPDAAGARMAKFVGRKAERVGAFVQVGCDRGGVQFTTLETLNNDFLPGELTPIAPASLPYVAFIGLGSRDMEATRAFLDAAEVPYTDHFENVVLHPDQALGTGMIIRPSAL